MRKCENDLTCEFSAVDGGDQPCKSCNGENRYQHVKASSGAAVDKAISEDAIAKTPTATKFDDGKPSISALLEKAALPALAEIAAVRKVGIKKYGKANIWKGMKWSRLSDAALRHLTAFLDGEDHDPETKRHHLAHCAINIIFLLAFALAGIGDDDREAE